MAQIIYDPVDGLVRLALSFVLVGLVIAISYSRRLRIEREVGWASLRAIIQLMVVVLIIAAVFRSESLLLTTLILVGMALIAGYTSARRGPGLPRPLAITIPAVGAGSAIGLGILIVLGVLPLIPEFLIPIGSMSIGSCMVVCSLTMDRLVREADTHRSLIETSLSLGATAREAFEPLVRESVRAALIPHLDRLMTLGLVVLPGTLAGMIIGGVDPFWAAEYQLIVMFLILGSGTVTGVTAAVLSEGQLFTPAAQLLPITPKPGRKDRR